MNATPPLKFKNSTHLDWLVLQPQISDEKMDLDEWEFIPDDGFLEIHDDGGKRIYSRKYVKDSLNLCDFNMNYFKSPSPNSQKFVQPTEVSRVPKQLFPLPMNFQPNIQNSPDDHGVVKEIAASVPSMINVKNKAPNTGAALEEAEQDLVSQVFFKKMKENEFVDMKMDSPKSCSRGILPQIEAGKFQFEEKDDRAMETTVEKEMVAIKEEDRVIQWEQSNHSGVNMWKWSFTGIGAICSFGVAAAATICIIILGSGTKNRQHQHNHQKLRFQIYADDKRIKEVVGQASRLNEAISAARGIPLARAHITFGGYYEGL